MVAKKRDQATKEPEKGGPAWELGLYVAGANPKSITAFQNLKRICTEHLPGIYRIEVIDLLKDPQLAKADQIIALPTVIRKRPLPIRKIIGDLSNAERVLSGFDIEVGTPKVSTTDKRKRARPK